MKNALYNCLLGAFLFLPLYLLSQHSSTEALVHTQEGEAHHLASAIIDSMKVYQLLYPQEKVFLHLNMPIYSKRDIIHFKAYLTQARTHSHFTPSKVVHIDLIDPAGSIVDSLSLHTQKGMAGSFALSDSMRSGTYQIRAYTQYMRNYPSANFFEQSLEVIDPSFSLFQAEKPQINNPANKSEASSINIRFFPEGGEMVEGLQSKIAYEIKDHQGNAIKIEGQILDEEGKELIKFEPSHEGMGVFSLVPKTGKAYRAILRKEGQALAFPLPTPRKDGFVMECNNLLVDQLFIEVKSSEGRNLDGAFVIGHVRGEVFGLYEQLRDGLAISIPKTTIPTGIAHFTLFDAKGNPQAERLVFNEDGYQGEEVLHRFSKDVYTAREKIEFEINLPTKIPPSTYQSLSLTVVDELMIPDFQNVPSISSYLYLNSELDQQVNNPDFYLKKASPEHRFLLDLILLTKGWRRFTWKDVLGPKPSTLPYLAEQGLNLQGFISKKYKEKARVPAKVMINSLNEEFFLAQVETDAQGNFTFQNLPFVDTTAFLLQASMLKRDKKKKNKDEISIDGNRWVDFHLNPLEKPVVAPKQAEVALLQDRLSPAFLRNAASIDSLESLLEEAQKLIELDSVEITARQRNRFRLGDNTFFLDDQDWIHPETPALDLMKRLKPRSRYTNNFGRGTLTNTFRGGGADPEVTVEVKIVIDGMLSNSSRLLGLKADYISMITITSTAVFIITRDKGSRSSPNSPKPGSYLYFHNGYHAAREFYAPDYSKDDPRYDLPDLRRAIHWQPDIKLDEEGKASISFYAADLPTRYAFRLEGMIGNEPLSKQFSVQIK